jgi:glycine cleavage system H protein
MSNIPADRRYTRSHEWLQQRADGTVEIGISDHAQESLGDLVFVELPELGRELRAGEAFAVVESVKAASDLYAPVAGTVVEINEQLRSSPGLINQDPYAAGWVIRLRPSAPGTPATLLAASDYERLAAAG